MTELGEKLAGVKQALDAAMAEIDAGSDHNGLLQALVAIGFLHDSVIALVKALAESLLASTRED